MRLRNVDRIYTRVFRYPGNNLFYISLNTYGFSRFICSWIGAVPDCYIFHSRSLNGKFQPFHVSDDLNVVHDSDESDEDGASVDGQDGNDNQHLERVYDYIDVEEDCGGESEE